MFQRQRQTNTALPPDAPRTGASDPWNAAGDARGSDQGVWILSYLDVMMILFAFFVLLFAYQKTLAPSAPEPRKAVAAQGQKPARSERSPAAKPTMPAPPVDATVTAMLSQAPLTSVSRNLPRQVRVEPPPKPIAVATGDSVAVAAQFAFASSGQRISQALQKETDGRQVEVVSAGRGVRLELSEAILFEPASAELTKGGGQLLDRVLPVLLQQPGTVFVEGHTDSTPIANARFPSNWELSTARATAVTRYLIDKGIGSERIRAVGLADTHPRSANADAEGRARNRRVTLVLGEDQSAR